MNNKYTAGLPLCKQRPIKLDKLCPDRKNSPLYRQIIVFLPRIGSVYTTEIREQKRKLKTLYS